MAKRRRLSPTPETVPSEENSMIVRHPLGFASSQRRPPVADIAADAATTAAFDQLSDELIAARQEGRMVIKVPIASIKADHLMRDRVFYDQEEMQVLMDSLRARGQQTPIDVVDLGQGSYGLIAGARRVLALKALYEETGLESFSLIQCLVRSPETAEDTYVAMIEENEIRASISFYERGRLVSEAVRMGIFGDVKTAVKVLFATATPARWSKILTFVALHDALGAELRFPVQIPEKLGLPLVKQFKADPSVLPRLRKMLAAHADRTAADERKILEDCLVKARSALKESGTQVAKGVTLLQKKGHVVLRGDGVDDDLVAALKEFLTTRLS